MFHGAAVFFFLKRNAAITILCTGKLPRQEPVTAGSFVRDPAAGTDKQRHFSFYLSCYVLCSNDSMMVSGGTLYICDNFSRKVFTIPVD